MSRALISQRVAFGVSLAAVMVAVPLAMKAGPLVPSPQSNAPVEAQQPSARARAAEQTALDRYVAAPDPSFAWKPVRDLPAGEGMTATLLEMTSQKWLTEQEVERPLWTHWLTVIRPAKVTSDVGLLFITGGAVDRPAPAQPPALLVAAAPQSGTAT